LPAATWVRLHRVIEETPTALLLLGDDHVAQSPGGMSLTLLSPEIAFVGAPGPGRILMHLRGGVTSCSGRFMRSASFQRVSFSS
jgi:hypothetical protein